MTFKPQTLQQKISFSQDLSTRKDPVLRAALAVCDPSVPGSLFGELPSPKRFDWLACHSEPGQSFQDFQKVATKPNSQRRILYFLPIGDTGFKNSQEFLADCERFAKLFFLGLEVTFLPSVQISELEGVKSRHGDLKQRQLCSKDILVFLKKRVPQDAFCLTAITGEDLYPAEDWNFVFGQASLKNRVGVYSFARYTWFQSSPPSNSYPKADLWRSLRVMCHEVCHQFAMMHCISYSCLLNGSNHLDESDIRPMDLCPLCLQKLAFCLEELGQAFDVKKRLEGLRLFCSEQGFHLEEKWFGERLLALKDAS